MDDKYSYCSGLFILIGVLPDGIDNAVVGIIIWGSAIWVFVDVKKLEIHKYKTTILSLSSVPLSAAFVVLLLWPITFPMYISYRQRIIDGKIPFNKEKASD